MIFLSSPDGLPLSKESTSYSDMGGSFLERHIKVMAHAHAEPLAANSLIRLANRPEIGSHRFGVR
jgi:hypothetical protein